MNVLGACFHCHQHGQFLFSMFTKVMQVCIHERCKYVIGNRVESVTIPLHNLSFLKFYLYCLPLKTLPEHDPHAAGGDHKEARFHALNEW